MRVFHVKMYNKDVFYACRHIKTDTAGVSHLYEYAKDC
jgi:hypothetical protein